jgi:hypothetical protein
VATRGTARSAHHFGELAQAGHPVVLCTDDSGVFGTSLSREYALAAAAFALREPQLRRLAAAGVAHAFAEPRVKAALRAQLARRMPAEQPPAARTAGVAGGKGALWRAGGGATQREGGGSAAWVALGAAALAAALLSRYWGRAARWTS